MASASGPRAIARHRQLQRPAQATAGIDFTRRRPHCQRRPRPRSAQLRCASASAAAGIGPRPAWSTEAAQAVAVVRVRIATRRASSTAADAGIPR